MKKMLVMTAVLFSAVWTMAQTKTARAEAPQTTPAASAAASKSPIADALRYVLTGRQKNTIAAVEAMPADKFTYKPTPDQVTFGHLVSHMIDANYMLCSGASAVPVPKVDPPNESDPKDKLVAALKASFDFCSEALARMDDSRLNETAEGPGGQQLTRARFALGIASNWADHYAEAAMYLRQNGILPPTARK
jgi:DinB superfamily